ncbi:hypothetical protein A2U01_0088524, partial [Trifolium medium]|nr:hypothetical protein [Trifolium medium]
MSGKEVGKGIGENLEKEEKVVEAREKHEGEIEESEKE